MKAQILLVLLLSASALADNRSWNRLIVDEWTTVCKESGCAKTSGCGTFRYNPMDNLETVLYSPSSCEVEYKKRTEDREIRRKYGTGR